MNFSFIANFQTGQNPFNAANTHVTSSDIAFWGDLAYVGDYGGFRIFDVSKPTPTLVKDVRCYGPQGDPSVFDTDKDGDGCPPVTTKTGGLPGGPKVFETGNMFFFETKSGDLLSEYRNPRPSNDDADPTVEAGQYCSSHLGIPVPAKDRYLLVNAYYRGGSSVIDFSNPRRPREVAFADLERTNTWSAYTYPRKSGRQRSFPVYSNDGLSRNYGTAAAPRYPEAAYGFMRFQAQVKADVVGFDRLNPQLQERVIKMKRSRHDWGRGKSRYVRGKPAPKGARNTSARPYTK